jgi:PAS domain S-box-containing protein
LIEEDAMKRPLGDMCADIARYAASRDHEFLAHLLRVAALEAEASAPGESYPLPAIAPKDLVIGLWDWDVPNNIRRLDETGASLFGYIKRACFSEHDLVAKIHPDDVAEWRRKVLRTTTTGGTYSHQYRIIRSDRPVWVRAKGQCILDKAGRPERFPGVVIDITAARRAG